MRLKVVLAAAMLAGALGANLSAAPIFGTFDLAGNVTVSSSGGIITIAWSQLVSNTPDKAIVGGTATGDFAGFEGTPVSISDLDNVNEPPDPPFPAVQFISFDSAPGFPTLLINQVFIGGFNAAGCTANPPAVGQTCTPSTPTAPSPFELRNTPGVAGAILSTASFSVSGVTSDGGLWTGLFTASFDTPFQDVLANFGANGSVTSTYSGTFVVSAVPEAGTLSLLGLGLVGISMKLRRRRA